MAYSTQREVSDGTLVLLDISISYIERSEISVYFDDVLQTEGATWTWVGVSDAKLSFSPAVANGVEVTVKRITDLSDLRHRYSEGAAFTANSMDESFEQVLHIAQEATEGALGGDFFQDINMHTYKIKNLGQATSPTDAVSLGQYQADAAGAWVARNEAVAAKNTVVAAKDTAVAAKDTAVASSTSAQGSASTATTQAGIATTKASEAAASAASALASKNSITASATDATASKNAAATSATAAANSAAAALNPWQVISPTEIRYTGGVGVWMNPVAGGAPLQTAYRSTVWARDPADTPHIDVLASDFQSLPSYKSVRLQYNGQGVAGNLSFCPSVPAANTAQLEAINTDALVIGTNNAAPVVVATTGLESMRALGDGDIVIGSNRPVVGERNLSVANYSSNPAATAIVRTLCNGVSMSLTTGKAGYSSVISHGGSLYVGTGTPATLVVFRQGGVDCAYFGSAGEFRIIRPRPFGYDVGAGGTVTQGTSKSTDVTLNTPSGVITTHAQSIISGGVQDFTLLNSCITPTSVVCANAANHSSSFAIRYTVTCCVLQGGGGVRIRLTNTSGVTLAEAVPINFVVINGASA